MKQKMIFLLTLIILFSVVYNRWIFNLGILTSSDWPYFFNQTLTSLRIHYFSLWLGDVSLGRVVFDVSQAPTYALYGLLAKIFNISYAINERIIHFWPIVVITPISIYLLLNKIFKNKIAIFVGILVFSFNTYFLLSQMGFPTLMVAYSLIPLIFFVYMLSIEKKSVFYGILTSLLLFIDSSYETRGAYILVFILLSYLFFYIFCQDKKKYLDKIKILSIGFLPFIILFLLSFYWILGLGKVGLLTDNSIFSRGLFGSSFLNILYAITLYHPFWTGKEHTEFIPQVIPFYYWIIPITAFLGLFFNKKNKYILYFALLSLLGIFLTKQTDYPFSSIYFFLFKHFPGFNAFREASKFYILIVLGYSILIAGFTDWMWKDKRGWLGIKYGKYIITFIIVFIFIWNTKPLITGEAKTLFVSHEIPSDYLVLQKYLLNKSDYFRILSTPISSRWIFYTYNHPKISNIDILNADWNIFIQNKRYLFITEGELARDIFTLSFSNNLLNETSIRYIIVPLEDKISDDDFFHYFGKPRQYYINELNKISYLHRINIGAKYLVIYENYSYRPHVYITGNQETISKEQGYKAIDYKFVNPTEYTFSVKNVKSPFFLNFSEAFNSGWSVRTGRFNWVDALTKKNYFIGDKNHFRNDSGLNSYYINPNVICKLESCKVNKDGGYDISGTLYFTPQSYMYLGLIVSGITLTVVIGYLILTLGRNLYERKNK